MTTVLFAGDPLTPGDLTTEATAQKYFPEWVVLGAAYSDTSLFGRTYDPAQWKHAFGVTSLYVPTPQRLDQYSEILRWQTGQEPAAKTYKVLIQAPLIFYTALHLAGPDLTPATFRDGLFRFPSAPTAGEPDPLLVGPPRHLADDRLLRRRRRHAHLVEPRRQGHRRARQRGHRAVGVREPRQAVPAERLAADPAARVRAQDVGHRVRPRSHRARDRRATPRPPADRTGASRRRACRVPGSTRPARCRSGG